MDVNGSNVNIYFPVHFNCVILLYFLLPSTSCPDVKYKTFCKETKQALEPEMDRIQML